MKKFAYSLVILAACLLFQAQAAENSPPVLQAKIQIATQAYQNADSGAKEAKMIRPLRALEPAQAGDVGSGMVSTKKVGSLKVSKLSPGSHTPAAIGGAIGARAADGDE